MNLSTMMPSWARSSSTLGPPPQEKRVVSAGVEGLRYAQRLDNEKTTDKSLVLKEYQSALSKLLDELKSETDPERKKRLTATIEKSMSRAEALKAVIAQRRRRRDDHDYTAVPRRTPPVVVKKSTPSSKSKDDDELEARILTEEVAANDTMLKWNQIIGLEAAKETLQEVVVLPFLRPDLYSGLRSPPTAILLYGPPGTGKTVLAKAIAAESGLAFFSVSSSSLTSKWLGEAEKLVRALFSVATKRAPSAIFLDELDAILGKRGDSSEHEASRRLKNEFLIRLEECSNFTDPKQRVLFIGATNRPWDLDDALLRRLPRRILIPLPSENARKAAINNFLNHPSKGVKHSLKDSEKIRLAKATHGFSVADLRALSQEAALLPLRALGDRVRSAGPRDVRPVTLSDFFKALDSIKPSADTSLLDRYETWTRSYGSRGAAA